MTEQENDRFIQQIKGIRQVVINTCHGGFGLSTAAVQRYLELCGQEVWIEEDDWIPRYWLVPPGPERGIYDSSVPEWNTMSLAERQANNALVEQQMFSPSGIDRDDPYLVQVVEELGEAADGRYAELSVVEIPADVEWHIAEYDGMEHVAENHRTWR